MLRYSAWMWYLLAVTYHITLVVLSIIPVSFLLSYVEATPIAGLESQDLLMHFTAYFILTILWRKVILTNRGSVGIAIATGGVLEAAQYAIPWRSFSILDFLTGAAGTAAAVGLAALLRRRAVS